VTILRLWPNTDQDICLLTCIVDDIAVLPSLLLHGFYNFS